MKVYAVIVAAGMGTRMGSQTTKQLMKLSGYPVLYHTLRAFEETECVDGMVVVVREDEKQFIKEAIIEQYCIEKVIGIVTGGATRTESVYQGIAYIQGEALVLVHDGARPLVTGEEIQRVINALKEHDGAVLGIPSKDTIKTVDEQGRIINTLDRSALWQVQTPQGFRKEILLKGYEAIKTNTTIYDDASLLEGIDGVDVVMVEGYSTNIKITTPEDMMIGEAIIYKRSYKNA